MSILNFPNFQGHSYFQSQGKVIAAHTLTLWTRTPGFPGVGTFGYIPSARKSGRGIPQTPESPKGPKIISFGPILMSYT